MKKVLSVVMAFIVMTFKPPLFAEEDSYDEYSYEAEEYRGDYEPLGSGASRASDSTINASMVGWGLGLAIAIAILAGVLHQSAASHSSSNTSS